MKIEEVQLKLLSEIQSLPSELGLEFCNKALKEIYEEHSWGFLYERGFLRVPALINTGTVNVTKFSESIVASIELKAILNVITADDVSLIGRQFRTFAGTIAGSNFFYTITDYDSGTGILTIDPFYQDSSDSTARFEIFKSLYTAPNLVVKDSLGNILFDGIDFEEFEFISYPFTQRKLNLGANRAYLDKIDSSRQARGEPTTFVGYGQDSAGNRLFELYPIPPNERVYQVLYKREGRNLEPEDSIPSSLSYDLVLAKAKIKAYEWLIANGDKVGDKRSPNVYLQLIALVSNANSENSYSRLLEKAIKKDESLYPQALIDMAIDYPYYQEPIVETILLDF